MIEKVLDSASSARWAIPIRTPTQSATQDRHENEGLTSGYAIIDETVTVRSRSSIALDETLGRSLVSDKL